MIANRYLLATFFLFIFIFLDAQEKVNLINSEIDIILTLYEKQIYPADHPGAIMLILKENRGEGYYDPAMKKVRIFDEYEYYLRVPTHKWYIMENLPDYYFFHNGYLILINSGMDGFFEKKKNVPSEFKKYINSNKKYEYPDWIVRFDGKGLSIKTGITETNK